MCGFGGGGDSGSGDARAAENRRQNAIVDGTNAINGAFSGYNDAYYKNYEDKYIAQGQPDLDKQQRDATQQVLFGLARQGQTKGSAAAKAYGDIASTRANEDLTLAGNARTAADQLRGDVEGQRSNLMQQLSASADAAGAGAQARNSAAVLSKPPIYSPISNAFADITGAFAANEQARRAGLPGYGFGFTNTGGTGTDPLVGSKQSVSYA